MIRLAGIRQIVLTLGALPLAGWLLIAASPIVLAQAAHHRELPQASEPGPPDAAWAGRFVESAPAQAPPEDGSHPSSDAESLYLRLSHVGLDARRVFHIREATLERESLHIVLEDGTIAFTEDVMGRVTGAFFTGGGEILLVPAGRAEQASLGLFVGSKILEEKFNSAYLRFNDDTYAQLQPFLRPEEDGAEFFDRWKSSARNLAATDALRLFVSFSRWLPPGTEARAPSSAASAFSASAPGRAAAIPARVQANTPASAPADIAGFGAAGLHPESAVVDPGDRLLHIRVSGVHLGNFDVFYDASARERIVAAQLATAQDAVFYDLWTSFNPRIARTDPESPGLHDDIRVPRFHIRAEIHPPKELKAEANLELDAERGGQRTLLFELSRFLRIDTVEWNGAPIEYLHNPAMEGTQLSRRGNDVVAVIFPRPLRAGEHVQLRFAYSGDVLSEAGAGLLYVGARGTWYPNRGLAMADYDLEFHYPPDWTLVATGKRMDVTATVGNVEQTSHWVSDRPIPVAGFNLGKYTCASARAGDVEVNAYATSGVERSFPTATPEVAPSIHRGFGLDSLSVLPSSPAPSPARNAQSVADKAAHAVEFYSASFGSYPYSSLSLTQLPGTLSQGWPGLIFLSTYAFLTPEEQKQLHLDPVISVLDSQLVAHETAHQWWGDLVLWQSYRDQWIVEALANYSALMLIEEPRPADFRTVLDNYRADLLQKRPNGLMAKDAGAVTLGARLSSSKFPDGYEEISYGRGTWLFHMLRTMLRNGSEVALVSRKGWAAAPKPDALFLRDLARLRQRFEGKAMNTRDLQAVFEQDLPRPLWFEGRKSLDWFFEGWVNGTAIPRVMLSGEKFTPRAGQVIVTGMVLQKDAPDDLVTAVPIYAELADKSRKLIGLVLADGSETNFRLTTPVGTRRLLLDPQQTVLARIR